MPRLRTDFGNDVAIAFQPPTSPDGIALPDGRAISEAATHSATCLNCATPLTGPFCSACGQRDVPPYPSVRDLVVDAFWELSGWDGRFASTVRALIAQPGTLTRDFLEGRRARYISPLRLYLMCSLVYFLLAAAAPNVTLANGKSAIGINVTSTATGTGPSRPERVGIAARDAFRADKPIDEATRQQVLNDINRAPAVLQPFLRRSVLDPAGYKRSVLEAMPRMLFALLPVFAVIVALFYRGKKYPEHLYFAIHLHAFAFLAIALIEIAKLTRTPNVISPVASIVFLGIPVYATLAFRRTYGGSVVATLAKEAGIGVLYFITSLIAFILMLYIVSVVG